MQPKYRAFCTVAFVALFGCTVLFYLRAFYANGLERERRRAWAEAVKIPVADGVVIHDELDRHFVARTGKCPYCGGAIRIVPVSPSGVRIVRYSSDSPALEDRFYAYCPTPDGEGRMPFQFGSRTVFLSDNMVSWFFCKRRDALTEQEIKEENMYRARIGKSPVLRR